MKCDEAHGRLLEGRIPVKREFPASDETFTMSPNEIHDAAPPQPSAEHAKAPNVTHCAHIHSENRKQSHAKPRAFVRRKGKGKLTYQIGDSRIALSHRATLLDISEKGLKLIADQKLQVGTPLRISLETPHRGQILSILVKVRWVTALAENQFRVGCIMERQLSYREMQDFVR
jgi:PilZ domain-containing protein